MTSSEPRQADGRDDGAVSRQMGESSRAAVAGAANLQLRVAELEMENLRLHRLVTELLIKNQELRKALCQ